MAGKPDLITTAEAAAILCIAESSLLYLRKTGELEAVRFTPHYGYEFDRAKIEAFKVEYYSRKPRSWGKRAHENKRKRAELRTAFARAA